CRLNASNLFLSLILHLGNLFLIVQLHFSKLFLILKSGVNHTSRGSISTSTLPSIKLRKCSSKIITSILSFISGRLATKSNQIKQLIRNGRSASLQRTFKKSFTSFSHSTRNKTRDGLIRVRNIRALRSEERFSRNAETDLVCGLLLEIKEVKITHQQPCSITPQTTRKIYTLSLHDALPISADLPPSPTKSSNLSETAEVPACNVPSRSPLPALAIAPETKLGTASSGLGTLEP